ncbi:ATP-grasp domain-containing protein, partial [Candidatus Sarmatiella mevalonica]|uniref:ATP-grasp domain-containing protein n=1 Tax=Candidatus Sarmatiella mevalonica TaxID=2770581 RepID=UPI00192057CC
KIKMKELLGNHGIPVPLFKQVNVDTLKNNPSDSFYDLLQYFKGDFFVKPVYGASAIGAFHIKNYEDFIYWISQASENEYDCEEYINGTLYLCDSFIDNNKQIYSFPCEYLFPCHEYDKGKPLGIIPLKENSDLRHRIINFSERVHKALSPYSGMTHLEVFVKNNGDIIFLEIGARPGGAGVPKILEINYEFNSYEQTLRYVLGLPIRDCCEMR